MIVCMSVCMYACVQACVCFVGVEPISGNKEIYVWQKRCGGII